MTDPTTRGDGRHEGAPAGAENPGPAPGAGMEPRALAAVEKLRRMMVGSVLVLALGLAALVAALAYRATRGGQSVPEVTASLPRGARVLSVGAGDGRLFVTIEHGGVTEIWSFDRDTLRGQGRLRLVSEP